MNHQEARDDGYEDPAQRPARLRGHGPAAFRRPGRSGERWPPATLFAAVIVLLFSGLLVLAVVGVLAVR